MPLFFKVLFFQEKKVLHKKCKNWYKLESRKGGHTCACPSLYQTMDTGSSLLHSGYQRPTSGRGCHRSATLWVCFSKEIWNGEICQGLSWACHKLKAGTGSSRVALARPPGECRAMLHPTGFHQPDPPIDWPPECDEVVLRLFCDVKMSVSHPLSKRCSASWMFRSACSLCCCLLGFK